LQNIVAYFFCSFVLIDCKLPPTHFDPFIPADNPRFRSESVSACRRINWEIDGFALSVNTVTFETVHDHEKAAYFK
jgi:hypothetical protein